MRKTVCFLLPYVIGLTEEQDKTVQKFFQQHLCVFMSVDEKTAIRGLIVYACVSQQLCNRHTAYVLRQNYTACIAYHMTFSAVCGFLSA